MIIRSVVSDSATPWSLPGSSVHGVFQARRNYKSQGMIIEDLCNLRTLCCGCHFNMKEEKKGRSKQKDEGEKKKQAQRQTLQYKITPRPSVLLFKNLRLLQGQSLHPNHSRLEDCSRKPAEWVPLFCGPPMFSLLSFQSSPSSRQLTIPPSN